MWAVPTPWYVGKLCPHLGRVCGRDVRLSGAITSFRESTPPQNRQQLSLKSLSHSISLSHSLLSLTLALALTPGEACVSSHQTGSHQRACATTPSLSERRATSSARAPGRCPATATVLTHPLSLTPPHTHSLAHAQHDRTKLRFRAERLTFSTTNTASASLLLLVFIALDTGPKKALEP